MCLMGTLKANAPKDPVRRDGMKPLKDKIPEVIYDEAIHEPCPDNPDYAWKEWGEDYRHNYDYPPFCTYYVVRQCMQSQQCYSVRCDAGSKLYLIQKIKYIFKIVISTVIIRTNKFQIQLTILKRINSFSYKI